MRDRFPGKHNSFFSRCVGRQWLLTCLVLCICCQSGCTTFFQSSQKSFKQTLKLFKPRPFDGREPTEEATDQWNDVGEMSLRENEKDPDPWFKKYFMSEKARSIEHNLGID